MEAFARDVMALPLVRAPTFVLDLAKDTSTGGLVVATLSLDGVCVFDAEAPDLYEGALAGKASGNYKPTCGC